jgi:predicted ATPase
MPTAEHFFVITGGPGSGKTALVEGLAAAGFDVVAEAGRTIIREQVATGGNALPWGDAGSFAERMLAHDIDALAAKLSSRGPVYFDRGIPDVIGYLTIVGRPVPATMKAAANTNRYNRLVFIAPPWPEIFTQDRERKQTPDEARRTYDAMVETYRTRDYELIELPREPVPARVEFVLTHSTQTKKAR